MGQGDNPVPVVRLELKHVNLQELVQMDELLGSAPLFRAAGPQGMQRLLQVATPRRLQDGQPVYQEGDGTNSLFMVLRGEVTLARSAAAIATVRKGEFFGEAEVLSPKARRGCTATAAGPTDVAEFPLAEIIAAMESQLRVLVLLRETRDLRAKAGDELTDFLNRW